MNTDTTASAAADAHAGRTIVAVAWPTGRPIYAYTRQEIADGVDVYTRRLKADRHANTGGHRA